VGWDCGRRDRTWERLSRLISLSAQALVRIVLIHRFFVDRLRVPYRIRTEFQATAASGYIRNSLALNVLPPSPVISAG
jgi:hypothetical protein